MSDPISLKEYGLQADSLDCPQGGHHDVEVAYVQMAAATGGGTAKCLKCGRTVTFRPT
jgi:hypothetical protein